MSEQILVDASGPTFFHPDLFVVPADGEAPYLLGYKCEDCGKVWFPKLEICPECWTDLKQIRLSRTGKLYSYSIIHVGQRGIKAPYAVGYVDFPENVRIYAQLAIPHDQIKLGMDVEVVQGVVRMDKNGDPAMISYMFKAVE
ncbi:Zn-ribbon domain-containing OB-fold protein [Paradesulfitobacterium ferrireducens]|uniref:Zn-ribbon domain-containing OB-fold protein n=1 Tax=Paradesulfitobacterium ferrireducens TaxID=2816476 RepID=UPI001A8F5CA3|nr:OB-fold domain-containing protein [Paradesulfitobacterium ferrireducens]